MTSYSEPHVFHCEFVIDGPTFVRKRGGSFWEPDDALSQRTTVRNGLVLINCRTAQDTTDAQGALDAAGLVAGIDYAAFNDKGVVLVACPGIRIQTRGCDVQVSGSADWVPGPRPDWLVRRHEQQCQARQAQCFRLYSDIARMLKIDSSAIASAEQAPMHLERVHILTEAMRNTQHRS